MNGHHDTDRCTDVNSELDKMNGHLDTDRCADVSSEGVGQNEQTSGHGQMYHTDVSSELDRMNGHWDTNRMTDVSSDGSDKRVQIIYIVHAKHLYLVLTILSKFSFQVTQISPG